VALVLPEPFVFVWSFLSLFLSPAEAVADFSPPALGFSAAALSPPLPPALSPALSPPLWPTSARLRFFSLSDLKSVSYQPPPFSRNDGADISRFSDGCSHSGQSFSGSSAIFCRASSVCPQPAQRYS